MPQNIDPRQIEKFLEVPRIASERGEEFGTYAEKERGKTKWVGEGNVILPSGEFIKGEEFKKLPSDEQELLKKLGVEGFNKFRGENVRCQTGEWFPRDTFDALRPFEQSILMERGIQGSIEFEKTDEGKVMSAVVDGYRTYEEIRQVTGLDDKQIERAIDKLIEKGWLK